MLDSKLPTSVFLGSDTYLSALFSDICDLCSTLKVRDHFLHNNVTDRLVLFILVS